MSRHRSLKGVNQPLALQFCRACRFRQAWLATYFQSALLHHVQLTSWSACEPDIDSLPHSRHHYNGRGLLCLSMEWDSSEVSRPACRSRFSLFLVLSSLQWSSYLSTSLSFQPARLTTHAAETPSAIIRGHVSVDRPPTIASLRLAWRIRIRCAKVRQEGLPGALGAARPPRRPGHGRFDAAFHPLLIACL